MTIQDDLSLAKTIIADQQIAIARLLKQINISFAFNPEGELVHIKCGEPVASLISPGPDNGNLVPGCDCFSS